MTRGAGDSVELHGYGGGPRQVIVLGVPSLGMVSIYFMARLLAMQNPFNTITRHLFIAGREVGQARNEIVHRALDIERISDGAMRCSHVLFLDDDVLFHPGVLLQLLTHKRPIVSGLYYTKTDPAQPLMFRGDFEGVPDGWEHGRLVPVSAHGMGLCLIEADVFERMRPTLGTDANGFTAWFETIRDRRESNGGLTNQTEDVTFCKHARDLGISLAVDTSAQAFGFHFDTTKQIGYPLEQWKEFTTTGGMTWPGGVKW